MKRIRGKARLLVGYLVLLALSYLIWGLLPPAGRPTDGEKTKLLASDNREELHIAYRAWGDPADPVVLLLHGSPDIKNSLHGLAERLAAGGFHVLRPDLPGFGGSTRDPADPGIWLKTPLVDTLTMGRIEYPEAGTSINIELRPLDAEPGSGSQISLPAMRLLEAPLTGLPELVDFAGGTET